VLRLTIDEHTFRFTDSTLERAFLPIVIRAGLPLPRTRERVHRYRVDFYWPELGLVVEVDGGRFHRTPLQQTKDRERDHAHFLAGLTALRFTHGQIKFSPGHVQNVLEVAARRGLQLGQTG
jgi:very-short-patch-repair endonuclease